MKTEEKNTLTEIKFWLNHIFINENFKNISVDIEGNTEKGDGYMGDITFLHLVGVTENESKKEYDLVLKCSKRNEIVRETTPVKEAFQNEIHFYSKIFPTLMKFQMEKAIESPFNGVPKYFGAFRNDSVEIVALDNLKKKGYYLFETKNPMTRKYIDLVMKEYGRFHAISVAMSDQQPEEFKNLSKGLVDSWKWFADNGDMNFIYGKALQQTYDVLSGVLDEAVLLKWKNFENQITYVFHELLRNVDGVKVFTHGDCWNNNFMFKDNGEIPTQVVFLDFQTTYLTTPVLDLSYFLFCCISEDDIDDMDVVLKTYYTSFSSTLRKFGSNPETVYPYNEFLNDWKKYSKFGILLSAMIMGMLSLDKSDIPDITENAEKGQGFCDTFVVEVKNKEYFKNRMKPIVKYGVENGLTD